ncbi:MAG: hypothetical protein FWE34_00085 [Defluviitaleaceae bacterium]|nr:hypothetical protein [Defluviitaleaceae bacterium]
MDFFLELSHEQFYWLRRVVIAAYGEKVRFARDWEGGIATVIVFENGSYIWCLPSEKPYTQGRGRVHFPRFTNKEDYCMAYSRLEGAGLTPSAIGDFSDKTGAMMSGKKVGQYTFLSFCVQGQGLDFEICMEPEHSWAIVTDDDWIF